MAKYTELLAEYIEHGGELPAVFDDLDGFKDLFIGEYMGDEIGFETPVLFAAKLETRANLIFPDYLARIAELEEARGQLTNPTKQRVRSGNIAREYGVKQTTVTDDVGERNSAAADQPFNITPTTPSAYNNPSSVATNNAYKDTHTTDEIAHTDKETYNAVTDTETGLTSMEAQALYKALESQVYIIKRQLLKEFDSLFLKVY